MRSLAPTTPIHVVENGYDADYMVPQMPAFPNDGKIRIVYLGNIYRGKQDPSALFEAIQLLNKDPTSAVHDLEVIFAGQALADLEEIVTRFDVQRWVRILAPLPRGVSLQMQRDAFYLLFLPWKDPQCTGVVTGKLFEYLHSGTAILAIGADHMEESQRLIQEARAGCLLGNDVTAIRDCLLQSLKTKHKPKVSVPSEVLARFDRKFLATKMLKLYEPLPIE